MIAVMIVVRSLTDLLILFTLGAAFTSCGGLVAKSNFSGGCYVDCWDVIEELVDFYECFDLLNSLHVCSSFKSLC
jgi:hypothetical protein